MPSREPGPEDFSRLLTEQNPWLDGRGVPDVFAPPTERALARHLWERVQVDEPHRFQIILGPRRVGKTTVMYQTVRHLLHQGIDARRLIWLRLDHPILLGMTIGDLVPPLIKAAGAGGDPAFLFLDEVVYSDEWDLWLKTLYDEHWPVQVVATSSATAALRDRRLESGVGRWEEQFLTPYLFTEMLDLLEHPIPVEPRESLGDTLKALAANGPAAGGFEVPRLLLAVTGGFPELLLRPDGLKESDPRDQLLESQRVLRSDAVERAVYKDIPQSFGVDNPMALERLLYLLAGQVTGLLSPTRICSELGISQPTFDRYLGYLERAFIVFTLPNYSGRETNVQKRGRKLYFVDGAIRNAALQRGLAPLTNPHEMGLLAENMVAAHLNALATQTQTRLFHWRDGQSEVDMIYDHPEDPVAVEVGLSSDHSRTGLQALAARHPRFAGHCYLVTPDTVLIPPEQTRSGVGTIPLDTFLMAVGRQAEQAMRQRLGA